jgi:hypothetical protein
MPGSGVGVGRGVGVGVGVGTGVGGWGVALDGRTACTMGEDPQMLVALQARDRLVSKMIKKSTFRMRATINDKSGSVKFEPLSLTIP